jgi:hypothetical protein
MKNLYFIAVLLCAILASCSTSKNSNLSSLNCGKFNNPQAFYGHKTTEHPALAVNKSPIVSNLPEDPKGCPVNIFSTPNQEIATGNHTTLAKKISGLSAIRLNHPKIFHSNPGSINKIIPAIELHQKAPSSYNWLTIWIIALIVAIVCWLLSYLPVLGLLFVIISDIAWIIFVIAFVLWLLDYFGIFHV